jgi:hypothetical protein
MLKLFVIGWDYDFISLPFVGYLNVVIDNKNLIISLLEMAHTQD